MNAARSKATVDGMALHNRRNMMWLLVFALLIAIVASTLARPGTPNLAEGERLYAICAACHGVDGGGRAIGEIPVIAGQHAGVLKRQISAYRRGARWDVRMEHAAQIRRLGDDVAIADVAAYVASLPPPKSNQRGDGTNLALGARLYAQRCRSCHGANGEGDSRTDAPRLAAQHHGYLQRQFLDVLEDRRPELGASHGAVMRGLDRAAIDGIADHLSRITPVKNSR